MEYLLTLNVVCSGLKELVAPTQERRSGRGASKFANLADDEEKAALAWMPENNKSYRVLFRGSWIWITRHSVSMDDETSFHLECLGPRKQLLMDFVSSSRMDYISKMKEKTVIWTAGTGRGGVAQWAQLGARPSRPLNTVILPDTVATDLIADMEEFLESEEWYYARGIPYRRGYLLYGPPGTGVVKILVLLQLLSLCSLYYLQTSSLHTRTIHLRNQFSLSIIVLNLSGVYFQLFDKLILIDRHCLCLIIYAVILSETDLPSTISVCICREDVICHCSGRTLAINNMYSEPQ